MGGWMCKWSMDCGSVGRWTDGLWDSEIWGLFAFVGLHQSTTQRLKSPRLWRFRIKFTSPFVLSSFILNPRCHSPATQSCQNLPVSRSLKAGRLYFVKQDTVEWGKACVDDANKKWVEFMHQGVSRSHELVWLHSKHCTGFTDTGN